MKKIPKITVLASTVLLSTIFSPKAHAASEDIYYYKSNNNTEKIQASDTSKVYTYKLSEDKPQASKEESLENIANDSNKEVENEDSTDLKKDTDLNDKSVPVNKAKSISVTPQKVQVKTYSNTTNTKSTTSKESTKASDSSNKSNTQTNSSSFSYSDVYKYTSIDLDNGLIGNTSTTSNSNKSSNTSTNNSQKQEELKVVDKTSDGRYVLKSDGVNSYYYDNGVLQKNKDTVLNGKFYSLDSQGKANVAKNKWVNVNGVKYYANQNGYTQVGLKKIGNTTYNFEQNGKLSANKTIFANGTYYKINNLGIASAIRNQWLDYNGSTFYVNNKGGKASGLTEISGKTYYFNNSGMVKNLPLLYTGDRFYSVDSKGVVSLKRNTWVNYKGIDYYANNEGWRCQGITNINGKVYNLTKSGPGKNYYAYSEKDNATYYFDSNGVGTLVSTGKPKKDLNLLVGWMYDGMNNNMTYSMSAARTSANASDCSSAVFRAMIYAGFRDKGSFIGNTETLFSLGSKGQVLKEISEDEIDYGDIFVAGVPGQSLGAGGHTGIILDKNTIIHSNYTDNGISVTQRKGRMGDASGYPIRYYRLVGGSRRLYI
ncbi:MAG: peptidoglycan amidohydrolase family protein [Peptoniphilaceae bacterium]|nr:peptidoglycan amidohydrolase family protein [Peptoniphilaceae bacterium]MDY6018920.1 peptidoglycan amidohydrolase family protein [Anaerococcus sp.]